MAVISNRHLEFSWPPNVRVPLTTADALFVWIMLNEPGPKIPKLSGSSTIYSPYTYFCGCQQPIKQGNFCRDWKNPVIYKGIPTEHSLLQRFRNMLTSRTPSTFSYIDVFNHSWTFTKPEPCCPPSSWRNQLTLELWRHTALPYLPSSADTKVFKTPTVFTLQTTKTLQSKFKK